MSNVIDITPVRNTSSFAVSGKEYLQEDIPEKFGRVKNLSPLQKEAMFVLNHLLLATEDMIEKCLSEMNCYAIREYLHDSLLDLHKHEYIRKFDLYQNYFSDDKETFYIVGRRGRGFLNRNSSGGARLLGYIENKILPNCCNIKRLLSVNETGLKMGLYNPDGDRFQTAPVVIAQAKGTYNENGLTTDLFRAGARAVGADKRVVYLESVRKTNSYMNDLSEKLRRMDRTLGKVISESEIVLIAQDEEVKRAIARLINRTRYHSIGLIRVITDEQVSAGAPAEELGYVSWFRRLFRSA